MQTWGAVAGWKQANLERERRTAATGSWLVLADAGGVGAAVGARLRACGATVLVVQANPEQLACRDDFLALLGELDAIGQTPHTIVHCWSLTPYMPPFQGREWAEACQEMGFYSILALAQALGERAGNEHTHIALLTNHIHAVLGDEPLCPEKATVLGPAKVIPHEYAQISCQAIDLPTIELNTPAADRILDLLMQDLCEPCEDAIVAYRGCQRWVPHYEPITLPAVAETPKLRQNGVYLITGGLGGLGLTSAKLLARTVQARLVLTGRSDMPPREEWEQWLATHDRHDPVSRRLHSIQELEDLGAEVLVVRADVASYDDMRRAIDMTYHTFGALHGVIHTAGVAGAGLIQLKTREAAAAVVEPKLYGALVLSELLGDTPLDFFVLFSSLARCLAIGPGRLHRREHLSGCLRTPAADPVWSPGYVDELGDVA